MYVFFSSLKIQLRFWFVFFFLNSRLNSKLKLNSMTAGAQQTMRRTMEKFSNTTRFALACNQSTKIIEPIQVQQFFGALNFFCFCFCFNFVFFKSRCAILRYTRLSDEQILKRVMEVIEAGLKKRKEFLFWNNFNIENIRENNIW